ncbi:enoyl-CoA hydratase [Erythrobacter sp. JK5]|nr:enoyl-CoA hydratase [Erythrobacter sp. JK5]QUL38223.1 enoyl-CoA hydratase [Erythrobacter sp. JK5]
MFGTNTGIRFASAAFSLIVSAVFFAYAIIPASPGLMA